LCPAVTSLAAALAAALVAGPAFRLAGKQEPCCTSKSPRAPTGAFIQGAVRQLSRFAAMPFCRLFVGARQGENAGFPESWACNLQSNRKACA
jgi:hypothetical protein